MRSSRLSAAVLAASIASAPQAFAAVDDQLEPASPIAVPSGFGAAARKLIDDSLEQERAVVAVLRDNVVSRVMASSWRMGVSAPYVPRATAIVSRGPLANELHDDDTSTAAADVPDLSLGARWRVLHGDASSHVPAAAWMPDLQTADVHAPALRPTMNLSGEWALPNDFSLGVMPGMAVDYSIEGRRQATGTFALTLGKSWSPQWRTFVDMARDRMASLQVAGVSTTVDAGISFVAAPGTQIDFAMTRGISDAAPPFQAGLGVSSSF